MFAAFSPPGYREISTRKPVALIRFELRTPKLAGSRLGGPGGGNPPTADVKRAPAMLEEHRELHDPNLEGLALVLRAAAFAANKHRDQRRKDAEASPYINHPLALASVLTNEGNVSDANVLAAALLHDTIEDTETTFDELEAQFGPQIAGIVAEVTDDKSLPKVERKRLQIVTSASKSDGAKMVKLADKICNLRDIIASPPRDWSVERRQTYFDWAAQVIAGARGVSPALEKSFDEIYASRGSIGT